MLYKCYSSSLTLVVVQVLCYRMNNQGCWAISIWSIWSIATMIYANELLYKLWTKTNRMLMLYTNKKELRSCWRNMNVSCSRSFCNQISTLSLLVYLLVIFLTQRIFSILVIDVHYSHVCLSKVSACNIDALLNLQRCNDYWLSVRRVIHLQPNSICVSRT
jgi:hypothetical protein